MKKWIIPVVIIVILLIWSVSSYNGLVGVRADAKTAWADVESSYQRRNDLIGNLVNTVKGAADFERGTLTDVIEARSKATSVNIDPTNITPEQLAQFQQAQGNVSSALSRLLVTVERYPDLKANQNFLALQSQIEGTENRINVARDRYNEAVNKYDKKKHTFPTVIFASIFGFEDMARFKADEGAEKAPEVKFDFN
ncbi:LemA family protein [Flavobacterium arcticum]|uniref:LemA family protein n=1 Tax=Flavobacterium arcticum TaxID=1784713 RepID=A0A345H8V3_9FLAO|nr:LemA family protein [Flavobacterium arcticum]AXG73013.1 LemA family protein [Flavobacterium arcticum]KAF2510324.1 LemA family protein [Flavobacterium arcticum]